MTIQSFTLHVSGIDTSTDRYEDALYRAGCDDALVVAVNGELLLDFDREAADMVSAVQSAMLNVQAAGGAVTAVVRNNWR